VRAHAAAADVPAAALTADTERYSRDQVLAAGFDAWLAKPIDPSQLRVALRRVLASEH
jgi:CheY-like chemotaxis protein